MTDDLDAICAELERLDAEASPGPWRTRESAWHEGLDCWYLESDDLSLATLYGPSGNARKSAGAALIALMRTYLPVLLAERRRMKAALTQIADQRLYEEVSPDKRDSHEWSEGFDQCVLQARYALRGKP